MEMNPANWDWVSWNKAKNIPAEPGCYALIDAESSILYIGRSKILWNRLRNPSKHKTFRSLCESSSELKIHWKCGWDVYNAERSLIKMWKPPLCKERIRSLD
jgi:excinuclease UvrABC nuclease subunit